MVPNGPKWSKMVKNGRNGDILDSSVIFFYFSNALSNHRTIAWVPRPERLKGVKDEVRRPEGPPARSRGREGP